MFLSAFYSTTDATNYTGEYLLIFVILPSAFCCSYIVYQFNFKLFKLTLDENKIHDNSKSIQMS